MKQNIFELQFQKLQKEIVDLENRLTDFKPSNRRANIGIAVAILSALISALSAIIAMKK